MPNPYQDTITYWTKGAPDGFGGNTHSSPVQIPGRWEDTTEEFVNPQGQILLSRAIIYLPDSGTIPSVGDFLGLGTLSGVPKDHPGVFDIRQLVKTPDIRRVRSEIRAVL